MNNKRRLMKEMLKIIYLSNIKALLPLKRNYMNKSKFYGKKSKKGNQFPNF